eukprot:TRINITY_DN12792_c0_g1_i3.p1 TRINITY_DN12792_c0_g1~~TRINITY_DN12792_c0_g1_i3.p1  ORF type:complete len:494 (+),score=72.77 TRINITY_DN12792_c0_g1_i3:333-1814(+)
MEQWLRRVTPWVFPWSNATMRLQKIETHLHVSVVGLPDRGREVTMHHGGLPASSSWKICLATPLIIYACYLLVLKLKARRADSQLAMVQFDPMPINIMVCVAMLGGTMITVLKPFIALDFGASPAMVGVMQSSFSIAQFFGTLLMGFLSDTFGRKQLLLTLPIGHIVAHLGCAMSRSYTPFLLCRVLLGFFGGLVPIAEALIVENTVQEERAGALGRMMAFLALGAVVGPGVASLLSPLGFANIFYIAAVLALLIWMWLLYTFDDSWKGSGPAASKLTKAEGAVQDSVPETTSETQPPSWKMLVFWYIIIFGFNTVGPSYAAAGSMMPLYALDMYDMREQAVGVLIMFQGLLLIIFQANLTGLVSKQIGNIGSCIVGLAVACVLMSMLFLVHSPVVFVVVVPLSMAAASALIDPPSCAAVARLASDETRGSLLGIYQAFRSLGAGLGPLISGVLYEVTLDLPFQAGVAAGLVLIAALGTAQALTRSETSSQSS